MAAEYKGLYIELGVEGNNLLADLEKINKGIRKSQSELNNLQKSLNIEFDTNKFKQSQELAVKVVDELKNKIESMKKALATADTNGISKTSTEYKNLEKEIFNTELALQRMIVKQKEINGLELKLKGEKITSDLKSIDGSINNTKIKIQGLQDSLKLKFNDGDFKQAQALARQELEQTKSKADFLKTSLKEIEKIDTNKTSTEYKNLEKEILKTENAAKSAEKQLSDINKIKLDRVTNQLNTIGSTMLKVGAGFTAGVTLPLALVGKKALETASDLVEAQNVVDVSFKDTAETINTWSQSLLDTYGISELTAKQTSGMFKAMANGAKITDGIGTEMSKTLTTLTADFASFYNVSLSEANTALSAIFTGETESLKRYGIVMTDVNLQAYAMSQGIQKSTQDMDSAEKATLRYNFMLDQLNNVQGDFARTVGTSLANQTRLAEERFKSLSAELARELLPVATDLLKWANDLMKGFNDLSDGQKEQIMWALGLAAALGPVVTLGGAVVKVVSMVNLAVGTYSTVLSTGTAATTAFNAALATNPAGLVALAIGTLIAAIVGYNAISVIATGETGNLINKSNDLTREIENLTQKTKEGTYATNESANAELGNATAAEQLANELFNLSEKTNKTTEDKQRMASITETLNGLIPSLTLSIDSETGALNRQRGEVNALIDDYRRLAMAKAAQSDIEEIGKKMYESRKITDSLKEQKQALGKTLVPTGNTTDYSTPAGRMAATNNTLANTAIDSINREIAQQEQNQKALNEKLNYSVQIVDQNSVKTEPKKVDLAGGNQSAETSGRSTRDTSTQDAQRAQEQAAREAEQAAKDAERQAEEAARKAEEERKAKVKAYQDLNTEKERLDERWNKSQKEYGELSLNDELYNIGERAKRYRDYASEVLTFDYMTYEEKTDLIQDYTEKAEDIELEYFKFKKNLDEKATKAAEDEFNKKLDAINEYQDKRLSSVSDSLEKEKKAIESNADYELTKIQERYAAEEELLNLKLDGIDKEIEARQKLREDESQDDAIAKINKQIEATKALIAFERDSNNQIELKRELERQQQDLADALQEKSDTAFYREKDAEKEAIQSQIDALKVSQAQAEEDVKQAQAEDIRKAERYATQQSQQALAQAAAQSQMLNNSYYNYDNATTTYDQRSGTVIIQGGTITSQQIANAMNKILG